MRSLPFAASPPRRAPPENVVADHAQIHVIAVLPHAGRDNPHPNTVPQRKHWPRRQAAAAGSKPQRLARCKSRTKAGVSSRPTRIRSRTQQDLINQRRDRRRRVVQQALSRRRAILRQVANRSWDRARSHRLRLSCRITPGRTRHPIRSRRALPIRGVPILDPMRIHRGGRTKRSPTFGASTSDVVQEDHGALSTQRGIEATRTPKRIGA